MSASLKSMDDCYILNLVSDIDPLATEEEQRLAHIIQETGDREAINKLVEHNIKFVARIAGKYITDKADVSDLIQEGIMGMIRAAEKFKPGYGRFISYAVHDIKARCQRYAMTKCGAVDFPTNTKQGMMLQQKYEAITGKTADGISPTEIRRVTGLNPRHCSENTLSAARMCRMRHNSLNRSLGDGDDSDTALDMVPSGAPESDLSAIHGSLVSDIDLALESLPERTGEILRMRYLDEVKASVNYSHKTTGRFYEQTCSLDTIGERYGFSRERARQIVNEGLDALSESHPHLYEWLR